MIDLYDMLYIMVARGNNDCGTLKCENASICEKVDTCEKIPTLNLNINKLGSLNAHIEAFSHLSVPQMPQHFSFIKLHVVHLVHSDC